MNKELCEQVNLDRFAAWTHHNVENERVPILLVSKKMLLSATEITVLSLDEMSDQDVMAVLSLVRDLRPGRGIARPGIVPANVGPRWFQRKKGKST